MALHIPCSVYVEGHLHQGDTIAEATSAHIGMPTLHSAVPWSMRLQSSCPISMSRERMDLIHSLGAAIVPVTRRQGGFLGSIRLSEQMAETQPNVFLPRQFSNSANIEAYARTTGPELYLPGAPFDRRLLAVRRALSAGSQLSNCTASA